MVQRYAHLSGEHLRVWFAPPQLRLVTVRGEVVEDSRHIFAIPHEKTAEQAV